MLQSAKQVVHLTCHTVVTVVSTEAHWDQGPYIKLSGGGHLKLSGGRQIILSGGPPPDNIYKSPLTPMGSRRFVIYSDV